MAYLKAHEEHVASDLYSKHLVFYMSNEDGEVMVEVCERECGDIRIVCLHKKNTWNEAGTQLTCDMCGADGT